MLEKAYKLLRPGGVIYVIVHNEQAFQARLFGKRSPIYDVEHIYLFNSSTLPMICRKAGFEPVRTFNVANTYPLEYWLRMSPLPGKAVLLKAANFAGGIAVTPHPGCGQPRSDCEKGRNLSGLNGHFVV